MRLLICIVIIAFSLCGGSKARAQTTEAYDDFVARETVIFYDDLSTDIAYGFPAHWIIQPCCEASAYTSKRLCYADRSAVNAIVISANDTPSKPTTDNLPEPKLKQKNYLPDSFTLQYDFQQFSGGSHAVMYFHTASPKLASVDVYMDKAGPVIEIKYDDKKYMARITDEFDTSKWHHFALSYYKQAITCFLDDERVLAVPDCHFTPTAFILSADKDRVSYTNVRLATGKYLTGPHYNFDKLFKAKKFVTHAIYFDVKKSEIRPESIEFIKKLATWLKENRAVKLEIGGHTDGDGTAASNLKLSQDRADEVKKELILFHIAPERLSAKGYGATQPIQPNNTPEGKAENRRVEFIKQ